MTSGKSELLFGLACVLCLSLLMVACQRTQALEYVKYDNDAAVPRISAEDAKKDVDAGRAILVDSRGDAAYEQEHLPGAIVAPVAGADDADRFNTLAKGKKIIVYCT